DDGVRIYDDEDGISIGVDGHIQVCKLVSFLLHDNATHTPGPPPNQSPGLTDQDEIDAALQNMPKRLHDGAKAQSEVRAPASRARLSLQRHRLVTNFFAQKTKLAIDLN